MYQRYSINTRGRDFVVGDVHGHLGQLQAQLHELAFCVGRDRLFLCGDLVDRGNDSAAMVELVDGETYIAVMGNHESMLLQYAQGLLSEEHHEKSGGAWFHELSSARQQQIIERIQQWPWAIELETPSCKVGMVHGCVPGMRWDYLRSVLTRSADLWAAGKPMDNPELLLLNRHVLWSRHLIDVLYEDILQLGPRDQVPLARYAQDCARIEEHLGRVPAESIDRLRVSGIDQVYVGHSFVPKVTQVANCTFLDSYRPDRGTRLGIVQLS